MPTITRTKPYDAKKGAMIEQAREWYARSSGVVFSDFRGLTVKEIQQLRKALRKQGAEIHVLKNTLFRIAAGDDIELMPNELHNGPTAVTFIFENESACAKAIVDFANDTKKLEVKGGFFGGKAFTQKEVEALSKLPSREVLIAQVLGAIAAPLSNLVGTVEALYADPIRVVGAVADKVAEGSPLPAPAAEAPETAAPEASEESQPAEASAEASNASEEAQSEGE